MPSFSKIIAVGAAAVGVAQAACPNACSGKGTCGAHDECICFSNWGGNDCSLRQCPSFKAWVVTPNGDANQNGDMTDGSVHSDTVKVVNHPTHFNHYLSGTGYFESWSMNKLASANANDEGHYYMECANQGLCDRKSGQCECFVGYEGVACRRSACPNDCSGHGVCRTVGEIGASLSSYLSVTYAAASNSEWTARSTSNGALNYKQWDYDMSQSCVCDAGFSGADCSERVCPLGDDPLTTGQHYETQWVDVYSDKQFAGQITFTHTDLFGETWETATFETGHYEGTAGSLATDAQSALRGLPDGMLKSAEVTVNYCEKAYPGFHKGTYISGAITIAAATTADGQGAFSTDLGTAPTSPSSGLVRVSGKNTVHDLDAAGATAYGYAPGASDDDDKVMYEVTKPFCIRYAVTFSGRSGDLADLGVNTGKIIVSTGIDECDSASGGVVQSGTEVTVTTGTQQNAGKNPNLVFSVNDYIHVDCGSVSYGIVQVTSVSGSELKYAATADTVDTCATSALTVQRVMPHGHLSNLNGVGSTTADSMNSFVSATVTQVQGQVHSCTTGSIATAAGESTFTCTGGTDYNTKVHYNEKVTIKCGASEYGTYTVKSSTGSTIVFQELVADCGVETTGEVTVEITAVDWVVKSDVDVVQMNSDGHSLVGLTVSLYLTATTRDYCDVSELIPDAAGGASGTRFKCGNSVAWTAISASTEDVVSEGAGTMEATGCSGRGVCDSSIGICECFAGYYGNACSTQNALSAA